MAPFRPTTTPRVLAGAVALPLLALVAPAWGRPSAAPPTPTAGEPATHCASAGTLHGADGAYAEVGLCADSGGLRLTVSAPASCGRVGSRTAYSCRSTGTWTARHAGTTLAGTLPGPAEYAGPGTYDVTGSVHIRSDPAGVDLRGTVRASLALTAPRAQATHAVTADRTTLHRGTTTTVTYTVRRDSEDGDGSARFGLIGEEGTGVRLSTADGRCVNPLVGRYPATTRLPHALDCALTTLQPGRPEKVTVRVFVGPACSTVVSKLGYWMPDGQALYTGSMQPGPELTCVS
ncbi:hypothetical protein ACFY7C_18195 [Streptomyces sp. NPDC012769]|uniref:hypothetical protein n=1 Tax=Streptomyces sp. NPDC012769 TaxID=3364848 RepID=UPI00369D9708